MAVGEAIQSAFYKKFYAWGQHVARKPCCTIWTSLVITLLLSARFFMSFAGDKFPLPAELEQDRLWVPQDAPAIDAKAKYDAAFSTTFRRNVVYFTTSPPNGNVLTTSVLSEIRRFDALVNSNVTAYTLDRPVWSADDTETPTTGRDGGVAIQDVCAEGASGGCQTFGNPLDLWYRVAPAEYDFDFTDEQIAAQVNSGKGIDEFLYPADSDRKLNVEAAFGGIERDANGDIVSAKAVQLTYLLAEAPATSDERLAAIAWEDQLNYFIDSRWTNVISTGSATEDDITWESMTDGDPIIEIFPQTAGATSRELGKNIRGDLGALNGAFGIILLYAIFIFARCQPRRSRSCVAVMGCLSCGLSIMISFGACALMGVKTNPVVNVLPFVLIGIGVDDMFVLMAALEAQPADLPVAERMGRAMGTAGVSITVTSLTDMFAFLLGSMSQLPALSAFCIFATVGILADYLLQISFFAAFMALDAYREKNKKVDCCPCCCPPVEAESGCCCCACTYDGPKGKALAPLGLKAFLKAYYIPLMRTKPCKAFVLVAFTGLTAAMAVSAAGLKQDFQFRWFVNDDAALQDVFDVQDEYFSTTGLPVYVVTPPTADVDYSSVASQQKLLALGTAIAANAYIEEGSVSSWYPTFREWVHGCGELTDGGGNHAECTRRDCTYQTTDGAKLTYPYCSHMKAQTDADGEALSQTLTLSPSGVSLSVDVPGDAEAKFVVGADGETALADGAPIADSYIPPAKFYEWLDQFLADSPLGAVYASDISWNAPNASMTAADVAQGVLATRLRAGYVMTDEAKTQVDSMRTLRDSVDTAELGASFPYMFMYLYYEQYAIIVREAYTNLALALVAVFIICTIVISHLGAACMVMLCVILVDIDILGLMNLWDLTIDSVAIINLVLAIGLAVDYSAHVAHAFMQTPGTRQERVDKALEEMGTAVIHGAFSTFLAVVVLSVSKSYIFRIFFKQFFGIVVFGGAHGLILLPTLLSLIGPDPILRESAEDAHKVTVAGQKMQTEMTVA